MMLKDIHFFKIKTMRNEKQICRKQVSGMVIYCDDCKKHTGVYAIESGTLTIVTFRTNCCNKIVK